MTNSNGNQKISADNEKTPNDHINVIKRFLTSTKKMSLGIIAGLSISSQIDIQRDMVFIQSKSVLFQFSNALYPDRIREMPNLEGATEITPGVIKKMGYNAIKTETGLVILDYSDTNMGITIIALQSEVGKILRLQSGEILDQ